VQIAHIFTPPLSEYVTVPGTDEEGYQLFWYGEDPETNPEAEPLHSTTTTQATMYFADNHPSGVPDMYWLRVVTLYRATKTATMHIGLCVMGKGRLYIDGKAAIDLWSSHPKKTLQTPMFNQASMELTADLEAHEGQVYEISVLLKNESMSSNIGGPYVGMSCIGGVRIGCCEKIDPAVALAEAVEVARNVDVPIIIAGLNADYETEAVDRHDLELPPGINELVRRVIEANPKTVSQSRISSRSLWSLANVKVDHCQSVRLSSDHALGQQCLDSGPGVAWWPGNRQRYRRCTLRSV